MRDGVVAQGVVSALDQASRVLEVDGLECECARGAAGGGFQSRASGEVAGDHPDVADGVAQ